MKRYHSTAGLALVLLLLAVPARADEIPDTAGDFLDEYTGPHDDGLDVLGHEVTFMGDRLVFFGRMAGPIAPTQAIGGGPSVKRSAAHSGCSWSRTHTPGAHSTEVA